MTLCDNGVLTYHPSLHVSIGLSRGAGWDRAVSFMLWLLVQVLLQQPSWQRGAGEEFGSRWKFWALPYAGVQCLPPPKQHFQQTWFLPGSGGGSPAGCLFSARLLETHFVQDYTGKLQFSPVCLLSPLKQGPLCSQMTSRQRTPCSHI